LLVVLILTFAKVADAEGCERWNWTTSIAFHFEQVHGQGARSAFKRWITLIRVDLVAGGCVGLHEYGDSDVPFSEPPATRREVDHE
jgi:hypothetical protein